MAEESEGELFGVLLNHVYGQACNNVKMFCCFKELKGHFSARISVTTGSSSMTRPVYHKIFNEVL